MYLMRLDDVSEHMNIQKWTRMQQLLDSYGVKPIYGIIPYNNDPELLKYKYVEGFWELMRTWQGKGWIPAMHGYTHVFETKCGGINPVNKRSEFAGVDFERQCQKIRDGVFCLRKHGIDPSIFFAPAHTFDENTTKALKKESNIRIISDTIADNIYFQDDIWYIPQQSGRVRKLPFKITTFCYHPNIMSDEDYKVLENFLIKHSDKFGEVNNISFIKRKRNAKDRILSTMYFAWKSCGERKC